jgi:tetratricopeptide (TPR) repeat protein
MSNVAKLKKKAAEYELKKDFGKALAVYVEILNNFDDHATELDVSLFNRVGDLMLRQGNVADALDYYERAVDRYVDGGFYNNAIALCNKILRHSPGRATVYYKLGKISAHKGFTTDAKQNFLEYADRMQKAGNLDEAFRALKEFADLCPGQDDIRLLLADQLSKLGKKTEAVEQLQLLWARYDSEGRTAEAAATLKRMQAIDPEAQPTKAGGNAHQQSQSGLVFLDLGDPPPRAAAPAEPAPSPPAKKRTAAKAPPPSAVADLPILDVDYDDEEEEQAPEPPAPPPPAPKLRVQPTAPPPRAPEPAPPPAEPPQLPRSSGAIALPPEFEVDANLGGADVSVGTAAGDEPPPLLGFERTSISEDNKETPGEDSLLGGHMIELEQNTVEVFPQLIEQEASASLLREDDLLRQDSDDSSALHVDMPPHDALSPDTLHGWEPTTTESPARPTPVIPPTPVRPVPRQPQSPPPPSSATAPSRAAPQSDIIRSDALDVDEVRGNPNADAGSAAFEAPETPDNSDLPLIDLDSSSLSFDPGSASSLLSSDMPEPLQRHTMDARRSVAALRTSLESDPENLSLHRELAEALLESGDRAGGIRELELAMMGAERANELDLASSIAEEIARLDPATVRYHQKRVEYAFRTNDKLRLIEAYLALAGALLSANQGEKARAVYQRVLDLAPDDIRAQAALDSLPGASLLPSDEVIAPEPARPGKRPSARTSGPKRITQKVDRTAAKPTKKSPMAADDDTDFINLGEMLRSDGGRKSTRMIVQEQEPTGDEEADFADMLKKFKQGIAQNVDDEDFQSHYDLGVAFKEMGLLDEAIAEFQKALKAPSNRLPTYEALGQCFIEKQQFAIASTVLARALNEKGYTDEDLVGLLYLLGRAAEALHRNDEALSYYQRVFVVDIEFRDIVERIRSVEKVRR